WRAISRSMRGMIDQKIALLSLTRRKLDECIGCGCLSLERCRLYNRDDRAASGGTGPRFVLD
ncbi:MAG: redox-sensitive transcriptional activator SoxR, partial [Hyphomicrobium sp.]